MRLGMQNKFKFMLIGALSLALLIGATFFQSVKALEVNEIDRILKIEVTSADSKDNVRVYWDGHVEYSDAADLEAAKQEPIAPGLAPRASKTNEISKQEVENLHAQVKSKEFLALPECSVVGSDFTILVDYATPSARLSMMKCCSKGVVCAPELKTLKQKLLTLISDKQ